MPKTKKKLWRNIKPHTEKERKRVLKKYGKKCYLDSKRMKYPICNKNTGEVDCKGLNAALYYVNLNISRKLKPKKKYKNLHKKIIKTKKKYKCN